MKLHTAPSGRPVEIDLVFDYVIGDDGRAEIQDAHIEFGEDGQVDTGQLPQALRDWLEDLAQQTAQADITDFAEYRKIRRYGRYYEEGA